VFFSSLFLLLPPPTPAPELRFVRFIPPFLLRAFLSRGRWLAFCEPSIFLYRAPSTTNLISAAKIARDKARRTRGNDSAIQRKVLSPTLSNRIAFDPRIKSAVISIKSSPGKSERDPAPSTRGFFGNSHPSLVRAPRLLRSVTVHVARLNRTRANRCSRARVTEGENSRLLRRGEGGGEDARAERERDGWSERSNGTYKNWDIANKFELVG